MISATDNSNNTNSLRDTDISTASDIEEQLKLLKNEIRPLLKTKKKLAKIESEMEETKFLIASGIGTKADQEALRQTKKKLRRERADLRKTLEALPTLEDKRHELSHQLDIVCRVHGLS